MGERRIGTVTHAYGRIGVAAISLTQIDHVDVREAGPGDDIAVHVGQRVREHDAVLRIDGES